MELAGFLIDCSLCQERFALIRARLRRIEFHLFPNRELQSQVWWQLSVSMCDVASARGGGS